MKVAEFQTFSDFLFSSDNAKYAISGIFAVPNSWLFFEATEKSHWTASNSQIFINLRSMNLD